MLQQVNRGATAPTPDERLAFLKALQAQMNDAYKKGKPFRVQVDSETSVIMSLKKEGVSAEFIVNSDDKGRLRQLNQQLQQLHVQLQEKKLPVLSLAAREESSEPVSRDDSRGGGGGESKQQQRREKKKDDK